MRGKVRLGVHNADKAGCSQIPYLLREHKPSADEFEVDLNKKERCQKIFIVRSSLNRPIKRPLVAVLEQAEVPESRKILFQFSGIIIDDMTKGTGYSPLGLVLKSLCSQITRESMRPLGTSGCSWDCV